MAVSMKTEMVSCDVPASLHPEGTSTLTLTLYRPPAVTEEESENREERSAVTGISFSEYFESVLFLPDRVTSIMVPYPL